MSWAEANRDLRDSLQVAERSLLLKRAHQNCGGSSLTPETQLLSYPPCPVLHEAISRMRICNLLHCKRSYFKPKEQASKEI